jgi:two-component system, NtrC family, nitrogen regulation sensor histidine kinase NtrY
LKNFRIQIAGRAIFLTLNLFLITFSISSEQYLLSIVFFLTAAVQIFYLIKFIDTSNRNFIKFLQGINYSDFSQNVSISQLGKSFAELSEEMNKVLNNFKNTRLEKEESLKYLETVVEHVGIGLISFNTKGDVELFNRAAKKILKVHHIKNISSLDNIGHGLERFLFQLKPGTKSTFKFVDNNEIIQLMILGTEFRMKNQDLKLISLYNIQAELEEKEIEAWQKLIRVLTHEIMNSITPISSLASTANSLLKNNLQNKETNNETFGDINDALNTIQKRSDGLVNFVNKFRDISKIYKPNFQPVKLNELFYRIRLLVDTLAAENKINLSISINPVNFEIIADPDLIEHVLINLIKNSVQALAGSTSGVIKTTAEINERGKAVIKVTDNGPGISEDIIDKIFIPFYSTKNEGSGIGLSISQSIIRAHNGSMWVHSTPNVETVFTIVI